MAGRRHRHGAIVTLALQLQACIAWEPAPLGPRQLLVERTPKVVRATLHDGTHLLVSQPSIAGDSILGAVEECRPSDLQFGTPACLTMVRPLVWLDDLQLLEVRQIDPVVSALVMGAAVVVYKLWLRVVFPL